MYVVYRKTLVGHLIHVSTTYEIWFSHLKCESVWLVPGTVEE